MQGYNTHLPKSAPVLAFVMSEPEHRIWDYSEIGTSPPSDYSKLITDQVVCNSSVYQTTSYQQPIWLFGVPASNLAMIFPVMAASIDEWLN